MHPTTKVESSPTRIWMSIFFLMKNRLVPPSPLVFFHYQSPNKVQETNLHMPPPQTKQLQSTPSVL